MHVVYPAIVSALLFSIGVYGVLARRNTILVLMSVELMLNAVNLNLVAFDVWLRDRLHSGQVLTLFVIVIAAAEVGLGLAIILALYRNRQSVDLDRLRALAEPLATTATDAATGAGADAAASAAMGAAEGPAAGSAAATGRPDTTNVNVGTDTTADTDTGALAGDDEERPRGRSPFRPSGAAVRPRRAATGPVGEAGDTP